MVDGRGFSLQGYENGYFIGGSLFDNVTTDMSIYREEIFGPVVSVVRADSFDTAVKMVNDHEYGNGTAIFTRDGDAARTFADGIEIGMVGINVPILCRSPIIPSAAGSGHCLVIIRLMAWKVCVSTRG